MSLSDYTPPADASGGFFVTKITNGVDTHRERIHVIPFGASGAASPNPFHGATVDYAYTTSAGTEGSIVATWYNFVTQFVQANYPSTYTLSLDAVYKIVSGLAVQQAVVPNPTPLAGTNAGAVGTKDRYVQSTWSGRTARGGRFKFSIIGGVGFAANTAVTQTVSNTGVAYLQGANCAVVGHDGGQLIGNVHVTYAENRRLRKHYGQA